VRCALVIACSMARRMQSWSYSRLAMLVPCHVCGALLPLDEKTKSSGYREWQVCEWSDLLRGSEYSLVTMWNVC
jgi:hypothetical protein